MIVNEYCGNFVNLQYFDIYLQGIYEDDGFHLLLVMIFLITISFSMLLTRVAALKEALAGET